MIDVSREVDHATHEFRLGGHHVERQTLIAQLHSLNDSPVLAAAGHVPAAELAPLVLERVEARGVLREGVEAQGHVEEGPLDAEDA